MRTLLIAALALSGCTLSEQIRLDSATRLRAESDDRLCRALAYDLHGRENDVFAELERRGSLRRQYEQNIRDREVVVGMNICEMHAAWGLPERVDRLQTKHGEHWRFIYYGGQYAFSDDGDYVTAVRSRY